MRRLGGADPPATCWSRRLRRLQARAGRRRPPGGEVGGGVGGGRVGSGGVRGGRVGGGSVGGGCWVNLGEARGGLMGGGGACWGHLSRRLHLAQCRRSVRPCFPQSMQRRTVRDCRPAVPPSSLPWARSQAMPSPQARIEPRQAPLDGAVAEGMPDVTLGSPPPSHRGGSARINKRPQHVFAEVLPQPAATRGSAGAAFVGHVRGRAPHSSPSSRP